MEGGRRRARAHPTCQKVASWAAPAMLAQGKACLEKASRTDFVACMAPFHDARIAEQK